MQNTRLAAATAFSALLAFTLSAPASAQWEPDRAVEFIAMYGPGGGHDIMMRTSSQMMIEEGITEASIQVRNLPGGSGARAMEYLNQQDGSGYHLTAATSTLLTTPLRGGTELSHEDFTPIALLARDPAIVLVNSDSPYETMDDLLAAAEDETFNFASTSIGGQGHLIALRLAEEAGVEFNYVPFDGDGELSAALMGNQVDIISAEYGTAFDFIQSGDFRPLAVSADEKIADLPDVPTLPELGYDVVVMLPRGVVGAPNMPEEARDYWVEAFRELAETDRWQEQYIDRFNLAEGDIYGEEFGEYLVEQEVFFRDMLGRVGLLEE